MLLHIPSDPTSPAETATKREASTCLLCGAPVTPERHHGERNIFFYDCQHCHHHYYASGLVLQLWTTKSEDERARVEAMIDRANALGKTPHLSPL